MSKTYKSPRLTSYFFLLLTSYFLFLLSICYAYPDGWSDDILINADTTDYQLDPDIDVDSQNNIWITWDKVVSFDGEIYFSKRDSMGGCLVPSTNVSNNPSHSGLPRVVVDSADKLHIIWRDESPQGIGLWYAKVSNDGSIIVPAHLAVSGAGGIGASTLLPEIALNNKQETNIVWDEAPGVYNQMDYTKLDTLGDTLIAKMRVSPVNLHAYWPGIGVDSMANNHFGYRTDTAGVSDRLTYTKLDREGNILVDNKILGFGDLPTLIADKNQNIHIVYSDPTGPGSRIEYLKLDNSGNILIGPTTISLPQINGNSDSHMAIDSLQYLHIVWQADSLADVHVMYTKMDTAGTFVIPPTKIVYPYQGGQPRIAVDHSNRLHVVWIDARLGTPDIFYKRGENETTIEEIEQRQEADIPKLSVFPNPFCSETKIVFSFSRENEKTQVDIFDVLGRNVKTFDVAGAAGSIYWHGTDNNGNRLPAGVYFVRVGSAKTSQTLPVVILR